MQEKYVETIQGFFEKADRTIEALNRTLDLSWHKVLLQKSKDFILFEDELYPSLYLMLQFRHVERTGYGVDMKEETIRESTPDAIKIYTAFKSYILEVCK